MGSLSAGGDICTLGVCDEGLSKGEYLHKGKQKTVNAHFFKELRNSADNPQLGNNYWVCDDVIANCSWRQREVKHIFSCYFRQLGQADDAECRKRSGNNSFSSLMNTLLWPHKWTSCLLVETYLHFRRVCSPKPKATGAPFSLSDLNDWCVRVNRYQESKQFCKTIPPHHHPLG